jgi:two-component system NtrC family sensor kinase
VAYRRPLSISEPGRLRPRPTCKGVHMALAPKTIRVQIMMAFFACFLFMGIMIIVNYANFHYFAGAMRFFEVAEELNSTILEMRRYEKNYFLFKQEFNFEENLTYTNRLSLLLAREQNNLTEKIGHENYDLFVQYVREYTAQMELLRQTTCEANNCVKIQSRIRELGQNLLLLADQVVSTERQVINQRLQKMVPMPLINLLILVILLGFVIFFIGEKVVRPLARITRESEAVARGAFKRITPFGDNKNEIQLLISAINRMVSELENRQEQLVQSRKIASIGTLTSGIAHEINNPINNISLILESLIEDVDDLDKEERLKLYQDGLDQADRASEIVKNLLEFSRASHPKVEDISLEELVDKTVRLVRNELRFHDITFTKEVQDRIPTLRVDQGGLQQVLLNLFLNSIQAMENPGELKVVIRRTPDLNEARIDVIDTGPGIPEEYLDRIFDPFFTTKKTGEGTGLGLSVSYNIVKNNGGRLKVQSKPGEGTTFSIFLPLTRENARDQN